MERQIRKKPLKRGVAKVPVVMQMEAAECGAACLCMVAAYYGKWVTLEEARHDCGVSRRGANAKNLLAAAKSYGFTARGFRYTTDALRSEIGVPCILHWDMSHFVVLCGFRGGHAYLNDPARGELRVPMEEVERFFTGVVLTIEPGEDFVPSGKRKSMLGFAAERLRGEGAFVLFAALAAAAGSLFGILNPAYSRFFLDRMLTGENRELLMPFLALLGASAVLETAVAWIRSLWALKLDGRLAAVGNSSYMWKVLRLPMTFFSERLAGDVLSRQEINAEIAGTLIHTLAPLAVNTVMIVFYLAVMLRYSVPLALVGLASVLLNTAVSRMISKKRINITRVRMRDSGQLAEATVSGIRMTETIKANGAERGFFRKWAGYQASVHAQNRKYIRLNCYLGMIPAFLNAAASAAVLTLGVWLAMRGRFTLGMILSFQGFLSAFTVPADTLISAGQTIGEMRSGMERVEDVMQYPEDPALSCAEEDGDYAKLGGTVEMKHVTFGYSRLDPPLIEDFSLSMKPGSRVAFVGASGCGKSTLARLLAGLYQPWSGEILYDGRPICGIDRAVFTGSVAVVDQEIPLFEGTIADNIRMWDDTIEDFEMILAARDAQIYDDIMARDGGFYGKIEEGGRDFSGGQRQRIEIARVLAQDPSVLILDEATSALDTATEYELVKAVKDRGITCIVIAHRLSTVRDCDEIIVLDRGRVAERGTHAELTAKGGVYADLIARD